MSSNSNNSKDTGSNQASEDGYLDVLTDGDTSAPPTATLHATSLGSNHDATVGDGATTNVKKIGTKRPGSLYLGFGGGGGEAEAVADTGPPPLPSLVPAAAGYERFVNSLLALCPPQYTCLSTSI